MKNLAFLYPGQGAQKVGMGLGCYETYESFRKFFDAADAALDFDLKAICFQENQEINQTEYTQPALVATCLGITKVLMEAGLYPAMTAGLSLGEYAAVSTAGGLRDLDAVKLVRERGKLMQNAMPAGSGGMSAVLGMSEEDVLSVLGAVDKQGTVDNLEKIREVSIANYNCPGQIVITGKKEAVEEAGARLKAAGARRVLPLKVSGAFHSSFMEEAGEKLAEKIKEVTIMNLAIPYVANATADLVTEKQNIGPLFCQGISSSVRWEQTMRTMLAEGIDTFVEIGPGKTLAGFMKKIAPEARFYSVGEPAEVEALLKEVNP